MESDLPLTPLGMALTALTATLITLLPRRMAMMPILAAVCFLPIGESLQIAGLHFYLFRLVLLASLTRVLIRGEVMLIRWCLLDTLILCWATAFIGIGSLSHSGWPSFISRGGITFDWVVGYIVARSLLRDRSDFFLHIRFLAIMLIPLAAAMFVEAVTGRNPIAVLGGVGEISQIRNGTVRAQGAFRHPILAGTFGATMLPLMICLNSYAEALSEMERSCGLLLRGGGRLGGGQQRALVGRRGWFGRRVQLGSALLTASRARWAIDHRADASGRNEPTCVVDI